MIVLQVAMRDEAAPLIERLRLRPAPDRLPPWAPMQAWRGEVAGDGAREQVALVTHGVDARFDVDLIATQPATLAAHLAIDRFQPRLLINAGTAGGFAGRGARIGDVFLSRPPVMFHDRRIPLPGFEGSGLGSYPCLDGAALAQQLGVKAGVISTGNALDLPECDRAELERTGADAKEMEAAAIAWICDLRAVPMLAIKAITDLVDGHTPTERQFLEHLRVASEELARITEMVVRRLAGRPEAIR
ncbi:MAG: 5'-methylthioadenosine nucleosidase [Phycisphaerales bacterium JB039]